MTAAVLPGGYWDAAGERHRHYELDRLTGRDEELLADAGANVPAGRVTDVLARRVRRAGDVRPIGGDIARDLLVADRQALLLALRRVTFGDQVRADLVCPRPDCGERMSIDIPLDRLPIKEEVDAAPWHTMTLSPGAAGGDVTSRVVVFRLPNGADQEELTSSVDAGADNEAAVLSLLLSRCLVRIGSNAAPTPELVAALSSTARYEIEQEMDRVAPAVEQTLELDCPDCGRTFLAPFDVQRFFFGELRTDRGALYLEVHYLASHYHWGEAEILALPREKRRAYIEILGDAIEAQNNGA